MNVEFNAITDNKFPNENQFTKEFDFLRSKKNVLTIWFGLDVKLINEVKLMIDKRIKPNFYRVFVNVIK